MGKRTWSETDISASPGQISRTAVASTQRHGMAQSRDDSQDVDAAQSSASLPQISRKVKACAACRKQKIKCLMDDGGPPCRRCAERGLGCVLNKSLQTLIDEKSQFTDAYSHDLDMVYHSLQSVLKKVGLPSMGPLQTSSPGTFDEQRSPSTGESPTRRKNVGPSCDNSPQLNPAADGLSDIPIHSLYALTKLSAFRSPDAGEVEKGPEPSSGQGPDDFISKGAISRESANHLFRVYNDELDPYMYLIGCPYRTLDELRAKSTILTVAICTVAALHDPDSDAIYGICSDEFRRLMGACMFDRLVNRDSLRAMCIATYWLSDISWTISGYALRRAADVSLSQSFTRIRAGGGTRSDADCLRLWYILYICDQHLATLYGRQPIVRDDFSIKECERFLESPVSSNQDKRLVNQVAVMRIFEDIRNVFSQAKSGPLPDEYLSKIDDFDRQLVDWHDRFVATVIDRYPRVGLFPQRGIVLHLHFSKLHLYSHIFQGLGDLPISASFLPYASAAVSAAKQIIQMLLSDEEARRGLIGPSYLLSMTAFACMFLIKVSMKYGNALAHRDDVTDLISRLVHMFRSTRTGKWHLLRLMEGGLQKMLDILAKCPETSSATPMPSDSLAFGALAGPGGHDGAAFGFDWASDFPVANLDGFNFMDYNIGLSPLLRFDQSASAFGGPGHGL